MTIFGSLLERKTYDPGRSHRVVWGYDPHCDYD